jgi:hypothetical protein
MTALSGFVWFILGALWVLGIVFAWMLMKASWKNKQPDRMSDEWLEKRRRFKEEQ